MDACRQRIRVARHVCGISLEELLVLLAVGFVLLGPAKMPEMAREAARMLRTLRSDAPG
jgi:Sec-independent protein translocase protein TatA